MTHDRIDQYISALEQKLKAARDLKAIAHDHPELLNELTSKPPDIHAPKRRTIDGGTIWGRIVQYFQDRDNQEASVELIANETNLTRAGIREQFYRRHKGDVDKRTDEKTKHVLFKMKQQ